MTRRRRAPTVIALSLALGLGLSGVLADSATRAATLDFSAIADAYTASAAPSTNYGSATSLRVKAAAGGKAFRTYLRFDVAGVSGPVTSATLSLWVTDASDHGGAVHLVPGAWGEASITWANAPAHDAAVVGQVGPVVRRQWVDISLDGVIVADGSYGLVVDGVSTDLAVYGSRESGRPARLTVVTGASPTPTPSPTPQPTPSPTPTPDPTPSPSPSPTPTPDPTPSPSPSPSPSPTPAPDPTLSPSPSPSPASTLIVCDGNPDAAPLKLDGGVYADPSVLKVIRGCTFDHIVGSHAIRLRNVRNVLIEDNRFADIHSGLIGQGQHAIAIPGGTLADGIVVRHNTFTDIGGDGLQLADAGRLVTNIVIEDNTFVYLTDRTWLGGENAIDVKGVGGPVSIRANFVSGYRPCDGTTMECSGSQGAGITLHAGSASGRATAVTLDGNTFVDNTIGLSVTEADDTSIVNDMFVDQLSTHVYVGPAAAGCVQSGNSFIGPALIDWGPCL